MKCIINTEFAGLVEENHLQSNPYANSDLTIGRHNEKFAVYRNFAENLLLYDKIYILTQGFGEILLLRDLLSGRNLEQLIIDDVLHFIQVPFAWGYIQRYKKEAGSFSIHGLVGIGLSRKQTKDTLFTRKTGSPPEEEYSGMSSFDIEEAVTSCLLLTKEWHQKKVGKFARRIAKRTQQLRGDEFMRFVTNKTESDMKNSELLKDLGFTPGLDIENIPDGSSDIRRFLRLVKANEHIALMQNIPEADILPEQFFADALKYPLIGQLRSKKVKIQGEELFRVNKIPTPIELGTRYLTFPEILRLRNTKEGEDFRKWFHSHIDSGDDIVSAYVDLLKKDIHPIFRSVNSLAQSVLGLLMPAEPLVQVIRDTGISIAFDYLENNILERYIKPNPPKFFMENIEKIVEKAEKE